MANNTYSTYSLADVRLVFNHPNVGQCVISDCGGGRVVIQYQGDISSHTLTANGYPVINKMRAKHASVQLELPQNSGADEYMRKYANYVSNAATKQFALAKMTLFDPAANDGAGRTLTLSGVTPQKLPDENYDQTSGTRNYNLLAAEVAET